MYHVTTDVPQVPELAAKLAFSSVTTDSVKCI